MKKITAFFLLTIGVQTQAGSWATAAVPGTIEIQGGNGLMIWAEIGNPENCNGGANVFFVEKDHPQYDQIYATILAAKMSGKKIQPYIHDCKPVTWHSMPSVQYNTLTPSGAIYLRD